MPCTDTATTWHRRFLCAELDLRRSTLETSELCDDLAVDSRGQEFGICFPRNWALVDGAFQEEFIGDAMQFHADGTVNARSCLIALSPNPSTRWRWSWPP